MSAFHGRDPSAIFPAAFQIAWALKGSEEPAEIEKRSAHVGI
jgi:hypothetical protein